jgi:hypothetical protein
MATITNINTVIDIDREIVDINNTVIDIDSEIDKAKLNLPDLTYILSLPVSDSHYRTMTAYTEALFDDDFNLPQSLELVGFNYNNRHPLNSSIHDKTYQH